MVYRAYPRDARHGGLLLVGEAVTPGLRRACDLYAEDGYEALGAAPGEDLAALLAGLGAPRFVAGFGAGADQAWTLACSDAGVQAAALFYPHALAQGEAACPVIAHLAKPAEAPAVLGEAPAFPYGAAAGFYLDDDPAHDPAAAHLARLRTLALFRRSAGRGEA